MSLQSEIDCKLIVLKKRFFEEIMVRTVFLSVFVVIFFTPVYGSQLQQVKQLPNAQIPAYIPKLEELAAQSCIRNARSNALIPQSLSARCKDLLALRNVGKLWASCHKKYENAVLDVGSSVLNCAFTADGQQLICCSESDLIDQWVLNETQKNQWFHRSTIPLPVKKKDLYLMVTVGSTLHMGIIGQGLQIWNFEDALPRRRCVIKCNLENFSVSSDGEQLLLGCFTQPVYFIQYLQMLSGELSLESVEKNELTAPSARHAMALSPDGCYAAMAASNDKIEIWQVSTPPFSCVKTLAGHCGPITALMFINFEVRRKTSLEIFDREPFDQIFEKTEKPLVQDSLKDCYLISAGDSTVRFWNCQTGGNAVLVNSPVTPLPVYRQVVPEKLELSHDGRLLLIVFYPFRDNEELINPTNISYAGLYDVHLKEYCELFSTHSEESPLKSSVTALFHPKEHVLVIPTDKEIVMQSLIDFKKITMDDVHAVCVPNDAAK